MDNVIGMLDKIGTVIFIIHIPEFYLALRKGRYFRIGTIMTHAMTIHLRFNLQGTGRSVAR